MKLLVHLQHKHHGCDGTAITLCWLGRRGGFPAYTGEVLRHDGLLHRLLQVLGGLVGGPDQSDHFPDIRNDYQRSEIAVDYNAGLTGAAAGLASFAAERKTRTCTNTGAGEAAAHSAVLVGIIKAQQVQALGKELPQSSCNCPTPLGAPVAFAEINSVLSCTAGMPACKKVSDYSQCGGLNGAGGSADGLWPGYCCPAGQACQKNNQFFWICKSAVPQ